MVTYHEIQYEKYKKVEFSGSINHFGGIVKQVMHFRHMGMFPYKKLPGLHFFLKILEVWELVFDCHWDQAPPKVRLVCIHSKVNRGYRQAHASRN